MNVDAMNVLPRIGQMGSNNILKNTGSISKNSCTELVEVLIARKATLQPAAKLLQHSIKN